MTVSVRAGTIAVLAAAGVACTGAGDPITLPCEAAPVSIVPGTWCITITDSVNTCSRPVPPPYPAEFTQDGAALTATSLGATYAGTLCGATATMTGNVPGIATSVTVTFADSTHASGVTRWSSSTCSGTDTSSGVAGPCP